MKSRRKTIQAHLTDAFVFVLGGSLYSVAVNCFTSRNNILNGGFTGIATVLSYLFSTPIGTVIFILNIPLFILAYRRLGAKFVIRTGFATFIMSALIDIGTLLPVYNKDLLLSSLFGGILSGAGLGIIFIRNATTGGTDIIAKLLNLKYPHLSIGKTILFFDLAVVALGGIVYRNVESMLYALVVILLSSQVIDYIIYGINRGSLILIITEKGEEIRRLILKDLHRGVTFLNGSGGYTGREKSVILCACYDNQTAKFIKKIKTADSQAFFIVTQSKEILGEGFPSR